MSLNREQFISEYNKFLNDTGLLYTQVRVDAGGAMLMFGLRKQTNDIDISLSPEIFNKLVNFYDLTVVKLDSPTGKLAKWNKLIDIHPTDNLNGTIVDFVTVQTLIDILSLKQKLNRPKDQADIYVLEHLLMGGELI